MNINIFQAKHFSSILLLILVTAIIFSFRPKEVNSISGYTINFTDSTSFIPNVQAGWGSYSSYLKNTGDSVKFELILYRNMNAGSNWNNTVEVGNVNTAFRPHSNKTIIYSEPPRTWKLTIEANGQCKIKLLTGVAPAGSPVILPVKTKYKK